MSDGVVKGETEGGEEEWGYRWPGKMVGRRYSSTMRGSERGVRVGGGEAFGYSWCDSLED